MSASKAGPVSESIWLIDAHSLIFQVFHAIPEMSSPSGLPTNAIFGFARDVLYLKTEKRPDYLVCAFDPPGPTFRSEIYPEYKAHRPPPPDNLLLQLPEIRKLLEAMRVPLVSIEGYEADDVLATLARAAEQRGLEVFICTSDKDCRQLIDDRIRLFSLRKRQIFGRDELLAEWGIKPEQVVDLQALVGDSTDNVPGVPGIGEKTAAKLLTEFGTLENVLANVDKISGAKRQENLRAAGPIVAVSRKLVELRTDVPIEFDWEKWRLQETDVQRFLALCREWGFRSLADQVKAAALTTAGVAAGDGKVYVQGELFPFGANSSDDGNGAEPAAVAPPPAKWEAEYHLVDTSARFADFLNELQAQRRFAVDLETTSLEPRRGDIVGLAFCWQEGRGWYLPLRGPAGENVLDSTAVLGKLRPILENPAIAKVNQNIKYDLIVLRQHGISLAGIAGDPMVADYLLHAGERSHGLEDLSIRYLNHQVIPITDLIGKKAKDQLGMDEVPTEKVAVYAGEDADVAWRLCRIVEEQLGEAPAVNPEVDAAGSPSPGSPGILRKLYDEVEIPLIEVLAELEYNGIRLDLPLLARLGDEMACQLAQIEQEIYQLAGEKFNIASPKQLREILFDKLKLPRQRRTGITGESSTDQETLERLAALGHELPKKIVQHRQVAKLKGTYVDALPGMVNPATGRVHASFNQTVAATGRLSSSDPNLQNVPVRTEQGRQIRQAFVPEPGWVLLTADYSQIELRLLAHFSGDEQLRKAFADDQDIHAAVASQVFGVAPTLVTADMRRMAKTVNFGVIYGMSAVGLAQRLEIDRKEAARFIDAYFARYPKVLDYQARLLENCRKTGYVTTILGRRRAITGIRPARRTPPLEKGGMGGLQRNQPEREAINMEIQGSAADLLKLAMLNIYRRLKREQRKARMLLTVHDELVFEVPPDELKEVAALVEKEMTTAMPLEVALKVDVAAGPNWLDVEDV
jgi:DNA polymerase-1